MSHLINSNKKIEEYKKELIALIDDSILKRIISAYNFPDPVKNMEIELSNILREVLDEENTENNNSRV